MRVGLSASFERAITEEDVLAFARNSGDLNPLHVDATYAASTNFAGRVVHGAFQIGLASALVGMHLPGRNVLLGSVNARFPAPLRFPSVVRVTGELKSWNRAELAGTVKVIVQEASTKLPTAEIFMGFTLHGSRHASAAPVPRRAAGAEAGRTVLVTGASGGIGTAIVARLASEYRVISLVNTRPLPGDIRDLPNVRQLHVNLAAPDWSEAAETMLPGGDGGLYGVVHAAWPGAPRGGLLGAPDDIINEQLQFGTLRTIQLARFLFARVTSGGGRFVALGSIAGRKPVLSMAAYSLGKYALDGTVKLLAPEMARKGITVNAVCPSFVPVGINQQADERRQKMETALVPLGRLCRPEDVAHVVQVLLSPESAFVSGQLIELSGGQL